MQHTHLAPCHPPRPLPLLPKLLPGCSHRQRPTVTCSSQTTPASHWRSTRCLPHRSPQGSMHSSTHTADLPVPTCLHCSRASGGIPTGHLKRQNPCRLRKANLTMMFLRQRIYAGCWKPGQRSLLRKGIQPKTCKACMQTCCKQGAPCAAL